MLFSFCKTFSPVIFATSGNDQWASSFDGIQHLSRILMPALMALAVTASSLHSNGVSSPVSIHSHQHSLTWIFQPRTVSTSIFLNSSQSSSISSSASSACRRKTHERGTSRPTDISFTLCLTILRLCHGCDMPLAPGRPLYEILHYSWSHFCSMLTLSFHSQHMVFTSLEN